MNFEELPQEDWDNPLQLIKEIDEDYDKATNALKDEEKEENDKLIKNIKED